MKHLIASLLLFACASGVELEGEGCVFDGLYEFGAVPDIPGDYCLPFSRQWRQHEFEDECSTSVDTLGGFISCAQGNPVVECDGWGSLADGQCTYTLYVRRIAP